MLVLKIRRFSSGATANALGAVCPSLRDISPRLVKQYIASHNQLSAKGIYYPTPLISTATLRTIVSVKAKGQKMSRTLNHATCKAIRESDRTGAPLCERRKRLIVANLLRNAGVPREARANILENFSLVENLIQAALADDHTVVSDGFIWTPHLVRGDLRHAGIRPRHRR